MAAAPSFGMESSVEKANVGKSVVVKGHLLSREDLTIDGELEGTIDMIEHRLTIAANGNVRANVKAHDIEVQGYIEGKIEAVNKVYIRKGGNFVGDIHSAGIVIDEGGHVRGSIDLSRHPAHSHPATGDVPNSMDSNKKVSDNNVSELGPIRQLSEAVSRS
jgi:cytoskeletal protein CcmA (bactofilin family)